MSQNAAQPELFYEDFLDALRDDVKAIGGSKELGRKFWPEKEILAARNLVNDCLNSGRRERFNEDQQRYIMRRAREVRGFSAALCFICDETGFERPLSKSAEDEASKLQRQVVEAANVLKRSLDQLERLTKPPLESIGGARG